MIIKIAEQKAAFNKEENKTPVEGKVVIAKIKEKPRIKITIH